LGFLGHGTLNDRGEGCAIGPHLREVWQFIALDGGQRGDDVRSYSTNMAATIAACKNSSCLPCVTKLLMASKTKFGQWSTT
ncbi:MAG: hypothetical protein AAF614_11280, partial [Chloroflexota bacterium]